MKIVALRKLFHVPILQIENIKPYLIIKIYINNFTYSQ